MKDTSRLIGGRYQILREIAAGGMGTVYEAKHNLSQKTVALKVLHPHVARDDASRQRFLREVSAPAQIGHPGICDVYDAGFDTQDGSIFIAMELLRGETLRTALERGSPRLDQIYDVFDQLLDSLAAAHAKGIVHRDLKPENVFLTTNQDGSTGVKLVDFGIVTDGTADDEGHNVTQAGTAMGTPRYMSPEQATNARDVSAASDVWAVGVMLYEALAGEVPFDGPSPTVVVVHVITTAHRPLEALAPTTPAPLLALVDRCLSKKPEDRPADAGALRAELQRARAQTGTGEGLAAPASTPRTREFRNATGPMTPPAAYAGAPSPAPATPARSAGHPGTPAGHPGATPPSFAASAPSRGQEPSKTGGGLKWVLLGGGGLVAILGLGALTLGVLFATGVFSDSTGQVRIQSNVVSGEIYVDGASRGPLTMGRILELPVGPRQMEARIAGAVVAQAAVEVLGGELVDVDLSSADQSIPGTLGPGDETTGDGKYVDRYQFVWTAGQNVHIEVVGNGLDTYLYVRFPDGSMHENDDADGLDAGFDFTV
ncbi:MAG: protein kinase, partial [Deltaproteobacteria bacterium]|nr:protein kinase [Deltaproteobacteria bacterium]